MILLNNVEALNLVISIEKGLEHIKNELEAMGYEVFYIGENKVADAFLYSGTETYPYYGVNNIPKASAAINGNTYFGTLLVNVTNKSLEDIVRMLEKRVYSPLI